MAPALTVQDLLDICRDENLDPSDVAVVLGDNEGSEDFEVTALTIEDGRESTHLRGIDPNRTFVLVRWKEESCS